MERARLPPRRDAGKRGSARQPSFGSLGEFLRARGYIIEPRVLDTVVAFLETPRDEDDPVRSLLLTGPPGAGKSRLGQLLAEYLGAHFILLPITPGATEEDLLYKVIPAPGEPSGFKLVEMPLLKALKMSHEGPVVLLVDEIDKANPKVDSFFLTYLQDAALTTGTEDGEITVRGNKGNLIVVFTSNEKRELDEPLMRRVTAVHLEPMPPAKVYKLLTEDEGIPHQVAGTVTELYNVALHLAREGMIDKWPSYNEARQLARALARMLEEGKTVTPETFDNLVYSFFTKNLEDHLAIKRFIESNDYDKIRGRWSTVQFSGLGGAEYAEKVAAEGGKTGAVEESGERELATPPSMFDVKRYTGEAKLGEDELRRYMERPYTLVARGSSEHDKTVISALARAFRDKTLVTDKWVVVKRPVAGAPINVFLSRSLQPLHGRFVFFVRAPELKRAIDDPAAQATLLEKLTKLKDTIVVEGVDVNSDYGERGLRYLRIRYRTRGGDKATLIADLEGGYYALSVTALRQPMGEHDWLLRAVGDAQESMTPAVLEAARNLMEREGFYVATAALLGILDLLGLGDRVDLGRLGDAILEGDVPSSTFIKKKAHQALGDYNLLAELIDQRLPQALGEAGVGEEEIDTIVANAKSLAKILTGAENITPEQLAKLGLSPGDIEELRRGALTVGELELVDRLARLLEESGLMDVVLPGVETPYFYRYLGVPTDSTPTVLSLDYLSALRDHLEEMLQSKGG